MGKKLTRRIAQKIMMQKRKGLVGEAKRIRWIQRKRSANLAQVTERDRIKRLAWQARKNSGSWKVDNVQG